MKQSVERRFSLKDGVELVVREPTVADAPLLRAFFDGLPRSERIYLRHSALQDEGLVARLKEIDRHTHFRMVATIGGEVVGDATLDRKPYTWMNHVGDLRVIVDPRKRGKGVGSFIARELLTLGKDAGIERLIAEWFDGQDRAQKLALSLGFEFAAKLDKLGKDSRGQSHDLIMMVAKLSTAWDKLLDQIEELDGSYHRFYAE